jgi:hypothetical protein
MNFAALFLGLAVGTVSGGLFGINIERSAQTAREQKIEAVVSKIGCVEIPLPEKDNPFYDVVKKGYGCQLAGVIVVVPK